MAGALHGVLASLKAAAGAATDAFFRYVSLLLNTTSTNGAQNNTFLDSSTNAFSITRNGNTTQGTFSPFSQTGWSNYFDGTGDYLSVPRNNAFLPVANEDFTIEAWVYLTATPSAQNALIAGLGEYGLDSDWNFDVNSSLQVGFYINAIVTSFRNTTTALTLNSWNHVAVARSGTGSNNLTVYVNGVGQSFTTNSTTVGTGSRNLTIGADQNGDEANLTGYISNVRIVKGTAVYTSNFTPPTSPLTAITNTSLLTCQSNRFIDNSSNNFTITRNGDVAVQAFSPFSPTAAWSASTNGGSGYFDGTGDYLSAASDAAFALPAAFTFEVWLWPVVFNQTALRGDTIFAAIATSGLTVGRTDSGTGNRWGVAESNVAWRLTTTTLPTNAMWNHMVVVRDSSNNMALFLNGTRVANATVTTSFAQNAITIGSDNNQTGSFITGYMSGMRLVKGTAVYDPTLTTLTVPTAPLTAITNTSLLLNCTNAGIYDSASGNDLETVGNAQVSTVQKKFGTTSMFFDGTGDWLTAIDRPTLQFGTAPFTIEFWIFRNVLVAQGFVSKRNATPTGWFVGGNASNKLEFRADATVIASTASILGGQWYHIAVVREGTGANQTKLYIDGVNDGTGTIANNFTNTDVLFVGADQSGVSPFTGYIDDLRITNGVARYTSNFTAPTAAFPLQ